jgi:hypothetical protein
MFLKLGHILDGIVEQIKNKIICSFNFMRLVIKFCLSSDLASLIIKLGILL